MCRYYRISPSLEGRGKALHHKGAGGYLIGPSLSAMSGYAVRFIITPTLPSPLEGGGSRGRVLNPPLHYINRRFAEVSECAESVVS